MQSPKSWWERRRAYAVREALMALDPPRIVVADDDEEVRRMVATALRLDGFGVLEVKDGTDLCAVIQSAMLFGSLEPLDVIVTDMKMPGCSGIDVLAGLHDLEEHVPVVLMTAFGSAPIRDIARHLGADAVFDKPFDIDVLRAQIRRLADVAPASY